MHWERAKEKEKGSSKDNVGRAKDGGTRNESAQKAEERTKDIEAWDSKVSTGRTRVHHKEEERKEMAEDREEKEDSRDSVGSARAGGTRALSAQARGKARDKDG